VPHFAFIGFRNVLKQARSSVNLRFGVIVNFSSTTKQLWSVAGKMTAAGRKPVLIIAELLPLYHLPCKWSWPALIG